MFKEYYRSWFSIFFEILTVSLTFCVYFFTSKAFGGSVEKNILFEGMSYFHFIIMGDIILMIPFYFFEGSVHVFKKNHLEQSYEVFEGLPINELKVSLFFILWGGMLPLIRVFFTGIMFYLFSSSHVSIVGVFYLYTLSIISVLIFIPFAFINNSLFLITGRGGAIFGFLSTILAIVSGGFFPSEILDIEFISALNLFNPFKILLDNAREIVWNENISAVSKLWPLSVISLCMYPVSLYCFKFASQYRRRRGKLSIFI